MNNLLNKHKEHLHCKKLNIVDSTSPSNHASSTNPVEYSNIEIRINHRDKKYHLYKNNNFICELPQAIMKQDFFR